MLKIGGWRAAVLAAGLSIGLGASGALAQGVPPGCVNSNPNGAAAGALLGGVAGALLGNAASGRHKAGGTIAGGVAGALVGGAIGGSAGATPCPEGYVYREAPRPVRLQEDVDAPPPPPSDFWYGAPPTIRERLVFLRHRIERLDQDGWLSPRETADLSRRVTEIARQEVNIRDRHDGMLPPAAREQLTEELGEVARRLRWKEYRARHAEE